MKGKKRRDLFNPTGMLIFIGALYGPYKARIKEGNPVYTGYDINDKFNFNFIGKLNDFSEYFKGPKEFKRLRKKFNIKLKEKTFTFRLKKENYFKR